MTQTLTVSKLMNTQATLTCTDCGNQNFALEEQISADGELGRCCRECGLYQTTYTILPAPIEVTCEECGRKATGRPVVLEAQGWWLVGGRGSRSVLAQKAYCGGDE